MKQFKIFEDSRQLSIFSTAFMAIAFVKKNYTKLSRLQNLWLRIKLWFLLKFCPNCYTLVEGNWRMKLAFIAIAWNLVESVSSKKCHPERYWEVSMVRKILCLHCMRKPNEKEYLKVVSKAKMIHSFLNYIKIIRYYTF